MVSRQNCGGPIPGDFAADTHYEIRTSNGQQIAAIGKVVVVLFDWKKQMKTAITDELRKKVRLFQKEAE